MDTVLDFAYKLIVLCFVISFGLPLIAAAGFAIYYAVAYLAGFTSVF